MPSPISDHTVPWPEAVADEYVGPGLLGGASRSAPCSRRVADPAAGRAGAGRPGAGVRLTYGELADRADAAAVRLLTTSA